MAALFALGACGGDGGGPVQPETGTLEVTTSTTGEPADGEGYSLQVNGGDPRPIGPNETITVDGLPAGETTVELTGVANNCAVDGENPRTATVPADGSVEVAFEVACTAETGDLEVTASTSGEAPDGGYEVRVDGTQSDSIAPNGTVTFEGLAAGDHEVELASDASCSVDGENPRTVTVQQDETATTTFEVTCSEGTAGALEVSVSTSGDQQDDGYTAVLDPDTPEQRTQEVGANGTVTFEDVSSGDHEVGLADVADNCDVDGENPRTVQVAEDGGGDAAFDVGCWAPLDDRVVFESDRDGASSIYVMNPDGSGIERLTDPSVQDANPHVSPDGNRIVFQSSRGGSGPHVWVMNADGSGAEQLVDFNSFNPQWSPVAPPGSGSEEIVFADGGSDRDIWVVNADGSDARQLTSTADCDDQPTWSPDASRIAFARASSGCGDDADILAMASDGSGAGPVASEPQAEANPTWGEQSDGTNYIVFSRSRNGAEDLVRVTVDADGSNPRDENNLTDDGTVTDGFATFRPDASRIAFTSDRDGGDEDVYVMNADGSDVQRLTTDSGGDRAPAWSEDLP